MKYKLCSPLPAIFHPSDCIFRDFTFAINSWLSVLDVNLNLLNLILSTYPLLIVILSMTTQVLQRFGSKTYMFCTNEPWNLKLIHWSTGKACNTQKEEIEEQKTKSDLEAHLQSFDFPETEFTDKIHLLPHLFIE